MRWMMDWFLFGGGEGLVPGETELFNQNRTNSLKLKHNRYCKALSST